MNQNENIGAINFNDEAQIEKISFMITENDKKESINLSKKD